MRTWRVERRGIDARERVARMDEDLLVLLEPGVQRLPLDAQVPVALVRAKCAVGERGNVGVPLGDEVLRVGADLEYVEGVVGVHHPGSVQHRANPPGHRLDVPDGSDRLRIPRHPF